MPSRHDTTMVEKLRSWFSENQTLVLFLFAQALAVGGLAAGIFAYAVRLEVRVSTMETRGAEYTVARMEEMKLRIATLEQQIKKNEASIDRIVSVLTRDLGRAPP